MKSLHTTLKRPRLVPLAFLILFVASTLMPLLPVPAGYAAPGGGSPGSPAGTSPADSPEPNKTCLDFDNHYGAPAGNSVEGVSMYSDSQMKAFADCRNDGSIFGTLSLQEQVLAYVYMTNLNRCVDATLTLERLRDYHLSDSNRTGAGVVITGSTTAGKILCNQTDWTRDALSFFDAAAKRINGNDDSFSSPIKFVCRVLGMSRYTSTRQNGQTVRVKQNNCEGETLPGDYWHMDYDRAQPLDVIGKLRKKLYLTTDGDRNHWDIQESGAQMYMLLYLSLFRSCQARFLQNNELPNTSSETTVAVNLVGADLKPHNAIRVAWPKSIDVDETMLLALTSSGGTIAHPKIYGCSGVVAYINEHPDYATDYIKYAKMNAKEAGAPGTPSDPSKKQSGTATTCNSGSWDWIVCSALQQGVKGANVLDNLILDMLNVDVGFIFDGFDDAGTTSNAYYTAWSSFRVIAIAVLIIAGLIMVVSQALGFEMLDAYTIRKTLPRLLIAAIGISLSWPLMRLVIEFFDAAGFGIRELMYAPFQSYGSGIDFSSGLLAAGAIVIIFFAMGPAALTFLLTALIAALVGYLALVVRQIAIVALIILAPIAIACYVLPNTQKVWKMWSSNFLGMLVAFPIISALIAAGHILSAVTQKDNPTLSTIITGGFATMFHAGPHHPAVVVTTFVASMATDAFSIIVYFAPYGMIPMALGWSNKLLGAAAGFLKNATKGMSAGLAKVRSNALQRRRQQLGNGELGATWTGMRQLNNALGLNNLGRRAGAGAQAFYPWSRRRRDQAMATAAAVRHKQRLKEDPRLAEFASGEDDGNAILALSGGTERGGRRAMRQLAQQWGDRDGVDEATRTRARARARDAYQSAAAIGFSEANAGAALLTMAQNKSRAVNGGRTDIVQEGIDRLANGNTVQAGESAGTFAYYSRQVGRADIGGMAGYQADADARRDLEVRAAEVATSYAADQDIVRAAAAAGTDVQQLARADIAMLDGFDRTKPQDVIGGTGSNMQAAVDASVRMLRNGSPAEQERAAIHLLELHQSRTAASDGNSPILDRALKAAGVTLRDGSESVAQQLARQVDSPNFNTTELTRRARIYGEEIPPEERDAVATARAAAATPPEEQ